MDQWKFKGVYVGITAVLAMFGEGKTTGLIVDIGGGVTQICPVVEGYY